ncbi:MAG TPA: transporter [Bryobacteraceae bacterium]|nr:transporter [Bryobacteraceae bacterium]
MRVVLLALFAACCALAQKGSREMDADRPGFANSVRLVGRGVFQLESGWRLSHSRLDGERHAVTLEPAVRYGATDWLELRLFTESIVLRSAQPAGAQDRAVGTADLQPGIKIGLLSLQNGLDVAGVVRVDVPSGSSSQTSGGYEPGAELIWEQKLPRDFSVSGTWNVSRRRDEGFVWEKAASVSLNGDLSQHTRGFGEVYVVSPKDEGSGNAWVANAGVTHTLGSHLMLDASAGYSVRQPHAWFVVLGLSVRTRAER